MAEDSAGVIHRLDRTPAVERAERCRRRILARVPWRQAPVHRPEAEEAAYEVIAMVERDGTGRRFRLRGVMTAETETSTANRTNEPTGGYSRSPTLAAKTRQTAPLAPT